MKLSKREKGMLIFLGLLLISVAVYFFIVEPIHAEHDIAKSEYDLVESQYKVLKNKVKGDNEIDEIIGDYRDRIDYLDSKLPHQLYLEKIINDTYTHFESYDITIDTVTFNLAEPKMEEETKVDDGSLAVENLRPALSISEILDSYESEENLVGTVEVNGEELTYDFDNIGYMHVNMSFKSNYNVFKDALIELENNEETVIPSNINISKSKQDESLDEIDNNEVYIGLTVTIPFYYDNEVLEDIHFDYEFDAPVDFEEHGPFEYGELESSNISSTGGSSTATSTSVVGDFNINLRNVVSDLAAQTMTYASIASSTLDLDSNRDERYILDIVESNDKISFKFKNDIASYPSGSNYESLLVDGDNIIIKVNSTGRFDSKDNAGMTLILNNKSSKKVLIYVYNDDPNNPRFKVIVNSGQFDVIRN